MFSKEVSFENYVIQTLPCVLIIDNIIVFFQEINKSKLCPGNDDGGNIISHQVSKSDYVFYAKDKEIRARIEDSKLNLLSDMTTIRTASCSVLIRRTETRCPSCSSYRIRLNVMSSRVDNYDPATIKKNTPNKHMKKEQLSAKVKFLQSERRSHLKNRNRF